MSFLKIFLLLALIFTLQVTSQVYGRPYRYGYDYAAAQPYAASDPYGNLGTRSSKLLIHLPDSVITVTHF